MTKRKIIKIDETKCNGCGLCVPNCAEGALRIINGKARLVSEVSCDGLGACLGHCPQGAISIEDRETSSGPGSGSRLRQWPVQIRLVPSNAPYLKDADVLIAADCVPFAYANFHEDLLKGKVLLIGCPKLDDAAYYREKITEILKENAIRSITYAHMEVPCCFGLIGAIKEAISVSGKKIPFKEIVIGIQGERIK